MGRVKTKNQILSFFFFFDLNKFEAIYCIFPNFCTTSNVNYCDKKSFFFINLFFDVKNLKVAQKNGSNIIYF